MIELSRYVLAAIVVQTHLTWWAPPWAGHISVFTFYTLSGYLMTRVLNTRYGFTWAGTRAFMLNRILRLWPAYTVILLLALLAISFLPLSDFYFTLRMPTTTADIVTNVAIIGQATFDFRQRLALAQPLGISWSLSIEICCYLLLALYFGRSSARLCAFAIIGLVAIIASTVACADSAEPALYGTYCFQNRYGVVQAGFIPFAFGGLYHFHQKAISAWLFQHRWLAITSIGGAILAMFGGPWFWSSIGPFLGIPLCWSLLAFSSDRQPTLTHDFFGRASYHLFIAHMPVAGVLVTGFKMAPDSLVLDGGTMAAALCLSGVLVPLERRLNVVRKLIALTYMQTVGRPAINL